MTSFRYQTRGDSKLWTYEIRSEEKTVVHNNAFTRKKLPESEAESILQELRLGKRISRDISLADLYHAPIPMPSNVISGFVPVTECSFCFL